MQTLLLESSIAVCLKYFMHIQQCLNTIYRITTGLKVGTDINTSITVIGSDDSNSR